MAARAVAFVVAAALATGCGEATPRPEHVTGQPGSIVDVGGHYLYFECVGSESPTVVLEAGFGGSTRNWSDVQPQLGRFTRTCSYDRAGLGGSAPISGVHDAGDEIRDLERLLDRADIEPPYVLVGHSYGGMLARLFADAHPEDVAGVVLVDAVHPDQDQRFLAIVPRSPAFAGLRRDLEQGVVDGVDIRAGEALDRRVRSLGDTRLIVVTAGQRYLGNLALPPRVQRSAERAWNLMQDELAALSSDSVHVVALHSGHVVQSSASGQPSVLIHAVRAVVGAQRRGTSLAPCSRIRWARRTLPRLKVAPRGARAERSRHP